jgi:hypothetical protein
MSSDPEEEPTPADRAAEEKERPGVAESRVVEFMKVGVRM